LVPYSSVVTRGIPILLAYQVVMAGAGSLPQSAETVVLFGQLAAALCLIHQPAWTFRGTAALTMQTV
jgi:hypothetical protein